METEDAARIAELEEFDQKIKNGLGDRLGRWQDWMREPSFFKDLQFLLIGPAWLMHFIYRKAGIRY